MAQSNTALDKIKARILALSQKTVDRGCSEAEALAAAEMMGRLLEQYSLTMEEIDVRQEGCRTIRLDTGVMVRNETWDFAFTLARFADVKAWFSGGVYKFFGREADLQVVEYLFKVIQAAITHEAEAFRLTKTYQYAGDRRAATKSFKAGMARRVAQRLHTLKVEREATLAAAERERRDLARAAAEAAFREQNPERVRAVSLILAKHQTGTALAIDDYRILCAFDRDVAVVRGDAVGGSSLVLLKQELVEAEFKELGIKVRSEKFQPKLRDGAAYQQGQAAGDRVSLGRPVEAQHPTSNRLR